MTTGLSMLHMGFSYTSARMMGPGSCMRSKRVGSQEKSLFSFLAKRVRLAE